VAPKKLSHKNRHGPMERGKAHKTF
jgi:hypothetical protein